MNTPKPKYKITLSTYDGEILNQWYTDEKALDIEAIMDFRLTTWDTLEEYAADYLREVTE